VRGTKTLLSPLVFGFLDFFHSRAAEARIPFSAMAITLSKTDPRGRGDLIIVMFLPGGFVNSYGGRFFFSSPPALPPKCNVCNPGFPTPWKIPFASPSCDGRPFSPFSATAPRYRSFLSYGSPYFPEALIEEVSFPSRGSVKDPFSLSRLSEWRWVQWLFLSLWFFP